MSTTWGGVDGDVAGQEPQSQEGGREDRHSKRDESQVHP